MKKILFLICLFLFTLNLHAELSSINNYVTRTWSSADGIPGNSVLDIIQSHDGYIYFGTYESLVRFDGSEFISINRYTDSSTFFVSARSIFEDSSNNLWIGSNGEGIQIIKADKTKVHITQNDGLPNNSIRSFCEDRYGNVWVGTATGVVYITPGGSIIKPLVIADVDINHVLVSSLYCDTAGRIWMLTPENKGIFVYAGNSFQRYKELDALENYTVTAISQDNNGDFWLALGQDGIYRVSNGNIDKIKTDSILDTVSTYNIYCDSSGNLWFGSERGLVLYSEGIFSVYKDDPAIATGSINSILEDREHNVWVGTDNGGIGKISHGKFNTQIINTGVNAICEDDNLFWIGTDDGLLCFNNNVYISNELTELCKGSRVRHVEKTDSGEILVNCYSKPGQILYSKDKGIINWTSDEGIAGNKTRVSIKTKNGDIYCGTTTGLSIISSAGEISNFNVSDEFECEYIMSLYEDRDGVVWVGTDGGGIYLFNGKKIIGKITTDNGLAGNVVFKINQDVDGRYWICTGTGISCYEKNKSKFTNISTAEGLGSDSVFQIIIDDNNYAWMISNRGISSTDFNTMLELVNGERQYIDCKFYNQNDGLKSSGTNSTALSMKDRYGRLWFTMADGFAVYDPVRMNSSKILPIIQLVSVTVDDIIYESFDETIIIPPGTKHINIKYAGLSYSSSDQNRFSHMLEGFDSEYSDYSADKVVSFTNLKHGVYKFYVNVKNGEGLVSLNPACVELKKMGFIYEYLWFWIAVGIVLFVIIISLFVLMNKIHKKQELLLETKIQMATVELEMAKDDSDRLLKNILPVSIADRMKGLGGEKTIADTFDNVTVLFSDIVGFTDKTSHATAEDIVTSLNDLISRFDKRAASMGVEKIKTIGDAYMAACGVPVENPDHSLIMLKFAMGMFKDLKEYNKTARIKFNIRIGLNSGKVVAGVIGKNKFIYDIWGDTVNVASRMETCCTPGHIRFTESVRQNLKERHVSVKCRQEECNIKGKGLMMTYEIPE